MIEDHTQTHITAHASPGKMVRLDIEAGEPGELKLSLWLDRPAALALRKQLEKAHGRTNYIKATIARRVAR